MKRIIVPRIAFGQEKFRKTSLRPQSLSLMMEMKSVHGFNYLMYMLWCKFILGLMFFNWFSFLFAVVPDYGDEYMTKENIN